MVFIYIYFLLYTRIKHIFALVASICAYQGPDGYPRKVDIIKMEPNLYKIKYTPDDCGRYTIEALYDGTQLPHTPIYVQSFSTGIVSIQSYDNLSFEFNAFFFVHVVIDLIEDSYF